MPADTPAYTSDLGPGKAGDGGGMEHELGASVVDLEAFCMTGKMGNCSG